MSGAGRLRFLITVTVRGAIVKLEGYGRRYWNSMVKVDGRIIFNWLLRSMR